MDYSFAIRDIKAFHVIGTGRDYWAESDAGNTPLADRYQFKTGWQTVYARRVESPLVRIELADGAVGWGEGCAPICPEAVCVLIDGLAAPLLTKRAFDHPSACWDFLYNSNHCRGYSDGYWLDAIAALDIAIWDALGHRARLPVAAMLCQTPRESVDIYLSGPRRPTRAERIAFLDECADDGLRAVKLFVGPDVEAACEELDALKRGVPAIQKWMIDALWSFHGFAEGARAREAFGDIGVDWLECPLQPEDLHGHRSLAQTPGPPIALGEHFRTRFQASNWVEQHALDVLQPDICRMGFTEGFRLGKTAAEHRIPSTPHAGSGLLLVQATALQFASAWPSPLPCEYQASLGDDLPGVAINGWQFSHWSARLPDWPGLGVRIDEAALARYVRKH